MSSQRSVLTSFTLGTALVLAGCGADAERPQSTGGGAGGTGGGDGMAAGGSPDPGTSSRGPGTTCATTNLAGYTLHATPVSFVSDILPMFGLSCVTSDCHNSGEGNNVRAGLQLGHKCAYDPNAKWKCTFPSAPGDPNDLVGMPAPDDSATVSAVYTNLVNAPAKTVNGNMTMRVKPGDPANSFLMVKLAGKQNEMGYSCTNQDTSRGTGGPCGDSMPLRGDKWCDGMSRARFDAIAQWIEDGAPTQ